MAIVIEVCSSSAVSAYNAQLGGANRVELCQHLEGGGTTPSAGEILQARRMLDIDLNVLIRPRVGDFLYSEAELEIIRQDILFCRDAGVDGVVMGFLDSDGNIDRPVMKEMMALARPMTVTFHRAFDLCRDPHTALEQLIDMGVDRLLTSGQQPTAEEGAALIHDLVKQAGSYLHIMPGSGIRDHNILAIMQHTGAREFHVSGRRHVESAMRWQPVGVPMGKETDSYGWDQTDPELINRIVELIRK